MHTHRREFLRLLGAGAALARAGHAAAGKPLRGLFPIGQTPFTESDKLDLDLLAAEVQFCNRGRVAGFVWPQIASGWTTLTERERLDGAEAILAAGKHGGTALAIGVQTKGGDLARSVMLAKHAERHGADAIVSLPPDNAGDEAMLEYYRAIGAATSLPLIVQTRGTMSVDLVVRMFQAIPTMRAVKDEAGNPLARVGLLRERTGGKLAVFAGNGVRTMIEELRLGFAGHCPTTGLADLYQAAFDLWHAGKRAEAFDMFGRILAFHSIPGAAAYELVARGVFRDTTRSRPPAAPLDDAARRVVRDALRDYLGPWLRA